MLRLREDLLSQPAINPENDKDIITIIPETLLVPTHNFTAEELTLAIKDISLGKATRLDNIPGDVWKSNSLLDELLTLCNKTFNTGTCPTIWCKAANIPIPKKGDLINRQNYRGISLIPVAVKIYNKMLLNRLKPQLEKILRANQNGFRQRRSTTGQILALRRIIEKVKINDIPAVLDFINFRKAFDSIHREKLFKILAPYGIPQQIITAIKAAYIDKMAQIITEDGNTDSFPIEAGVLQGDTLAPYLFIIMIDYFIRTAIKDADHVGLTINDRQSSRHPATYLTDTDFADEIALLSNTIEDAQKLLTLVVDTARQIGLNINEEKTEYMTYNIQENNHLTANSKVIKEVQEFKYLGSWIDDSHKDLKIRKALAWSAARKMNNIWKSHLQQKFKISLFRATVESILLYGSETWTTTNKMNTEIDGTYTKLLRYILNINWKHHVNNTELYGPLQKASDIVQTRRLKLAGHCWWSEEVAPKVILWKPKQGHRSQGGARRSYTDILTRDTGLELQELQTVMSDRILWRMYTQDSGAHD